MRRLLAQDCDASQGMVKLGVTNEALAAFSRELEHRLGMPGPDPSDLRQRILELYFQKDRQSRGMTIQCSFTAPPALTATASFDSLDGPLLPRWTVEAQGSKRVTCDPSVSRFLADWAGSANMHMWMTLAPRASDWQSTWLVRCPRLLARLLEKLPGSEAASRALRYEAPSGYGSDGDGGGRVDVRVFPLAGPLYHFDWPLAFHQGIPRGDWNDCLNRLAALEKAIAGQAWLLEWKQARFGRVMNAMGQGDEEFFTIYLAEAEDAGGFGRSVEISRDGSKCRIHSNECQRHLTGHWLDSLVIPPGSKAEVVDGRVVLSPDT